MDTATSCSWTTPTTLSPTLSRRALLAADGLSLAFGSGPARAAGPASPAQDDPCRFVDPFIGTGGHGHTYPGAATPFSMVQLSPDTDNCRWDACGGYHFGDATLLGFSHTHLSGTGIGDMLDVLLRPALGPVRLSPGTLEAPEGSYRARFSHSDEHASPGFYSVLLPDEGITAELTATPRSGLSRFAFGRSGPAHLLIDFAHGMQDRPGVRTRIEDATLEWRADNTLVGGRRVFQWASGRHIYLALRLSHPVGRTVLYSDDRDTGSHGVSGSIRC